MSSYTQQKFRLGTVWGQTGGRPPGPPLELPLVGGIVPMLLGGETPLVISAQRTDWDVCFVVVVCSWELLFLPILHCH